MSTSAQTQNSKKKQKYKYFLSGPIQWDWLRRASKLRGKSFELGIIYWHLSKLNKRETKLKAQEQFLRGFSINRQSYYRALVQLETAGLIRVQKMAGQRALVDLIPINEKEVFRE